MKSTAYRILKEIYEDAAVYEKYLIYNKVPLLLAEFEVRLNSDDDKMMNDPCLYFTLLRLLGILEDDNKKKEEISSACSALAQSNPKLYAPLMD